MCLHFILFFFQHFKYIAYCFLASKVSDKKSSILNKDLLYTVCQRFLAAFKILSLAFISLNKICLSVGLLDFIFLRVCWACCMCMLLSFIKLEKSLFLQIFSLLVSLFLLLLGLPHTYVVLQIIHCKSLRLTYSSIFVFL